MFEVNGVISFEVAYESGRPEVTNAVEGFLRKYLGVPRFDEKIEEAWQNYAGIICRRGKTIAIPEWLHDGMARQKAYGSQRMSRTGAQMTKPDDIPQDVWDAANDMAAEWLMPGGEGHTMASNDIARAIMAEREACALVAEERVPLWEEFEAVAAAIRQRG